MINYLKLEKVTFTGPKKTSEVPLYSGVNVVCGASDTGKSFLAECIDFMLGGSSLRELPERTSYASLKLAMSSADGSQWSLERSITGGDFSLRLGDNPEAPATKLGQSHSHGRADNLSGFLLEKLGLLDKRILKSALKGTTQSLSFRNLARLVIVQDDEIHAKTSPFWSGQFTQKNVDLATVKLLLTDIDDSAVVSVAGDAPDGQQQIQLLESLIEEYSSKIVDSGTDQTELKDQLGKLEDSIENQRDVLERSQRSLDIAMSGRRRTHLLKERVDDRLVEISELLARFDLLKTHYSIDRKRLEAILESGSIFVYFDKVSCPLCGAAPDHQHDDSADQDVNIASVVAAAGAEIAKIDRLSIELESTVADLGEESVGLRGNRSTLNDQYAIFEADIQQTISPLVSEARNSFQALLEKKTSVERTLDLYDRVDGLKERLRLAKEAEDGAAPKPGKKVSSGIPESVANDLSKKIETVLKGWNFPGECRVHFDKEAADFVIDGKPRGSSGRGLRAITHAAVSIGLLEYCQENELPHPGFVVLDSPLLAYFEPEGDEDAMLQGTNLKEKFYEYLIQHHADGQVLIIENQHPPQEFEPRLHLTVFTNNPNTGRQGLL